jgi:hypothetical protein
MDRITCQPPHRRFSVAFLLLAILLPVAAMTLGSCSVALGIRRMFGEKLDIGVNVDPTANHDLPLAMTVVYVYDEKAFARLLDMSSREWYTDRSTIENGYREDGTLETFDWEWVPGQDTVISVPFTVSAVGAVVYANYFADGVHRVRIDPHQDINLALGFDDMNVTPR